MPLEVIENAFPISAGRFGITDKAAIKIKFASLRRDSSTVALTVPNRSIHGITEVLAVNESSIDLDLLRGDPPIVGDKVKVNLTVNHVKANFESEVVAVNLKARKFTILMPPVLFWYERRSTRRVTTLEQLPFRVILDDGLVTRAVDISLTGIGAPLELETVNKFESLPQREMIGCAFEFDGHLIDGINLKLVRYAANQYGSSTFNAGLSITGGIPKTELIESFVQRAINMTELQQLREARQ